MTRGSLWAGERLGAAVVRAVSGVPRAEFQGRQLTIDGRREPLATPYLALDLTDATEAQRRGVADAVGLLLRHSDRGLHASLAPESVFEHLLFDVLEQLRCESLAPADLPGLRRNLRAAFQQWCSIARAEHLTESFIGLLFYTVLHMARNRLIDPLQNELDEDLIETMRGRLSRLIGADLKMLMATTHDQKAYADAARRIAATVGALAGDEASRLDDSPDARRRSRLQIPDWRADHDHASGDAAAPAGTGREAGELLSVGGYRVFTTEYDRVVDGEQLGREPVRAALRSDLDELARAQVVSVPRLAARLQAVLAHPAPDGWQFGTEDGLLDARRLTQLVANPAYQHHHREQPPALVNHAAVTFLVDNSGSMKAQKFESVAVLLDTFSRALDRAGVPNEVLGFSTGRWNGGRPRHEWHAAGRPEDPGRLTELLHVVYKDADRSWRRSRRSLAAMLHTHHYRESVDGEALAWAHGRLVRRPEPRKILVVVTDGAPVDASTVNANGPDFLADHLAAVSAAISRRGEVELCAVTVDAGVGAVYPTSVHVDLSGPLTLAAYQEVLSLLATRHHP